MEEPAEPGGSFFRAEDGVEAHVPKEFRAEGGGERACHEDVSEGIGDGEGGATSMRRWFASPVLH